MSDIQNYHWSVDDMFKDAAAFDAEFNAVQKALDHAKKPIVISLNDDSIERALTLRESILERISELYVYAKMKLDTSTTTSESQIRMQKASALMVESSAVFAYIEPALSQLDGPALIAKQQQTVGLKDYQQYIKNIVRQKQHYLAGDQEELIASLSDALDAPQQIYEMLTGADFTFAPIKRADGTEEELTLGNYSKFIFDSDRNVRRMAYENIFMGYKLHGNAIATSFTSAVKKEVAIAKLRGFESSRHMSLSEDNIDISVYDNLISATCDRLDLYHRYLNIRKQILGVDELTPYDLYVPLVSAVDMKIPFDQGMDMVKEALKPLGEDYQKLLDKVMKERWIDVYPAQGKRSGAYSWGTYKSKPFVFLNYNDSINDVSTLAHELGHSMHSYMTNQNQAFINSGYSLFVAEVASTVNESIMLRYLIDHATSKEEKRYLINSFLELIRTTIYRQTMFADFERSVHASYEDGKPLSLESLNKMYYKFNQKYLGDGVELGDLLEYEWARIPHFYRSFYVYAYSTGLSAALNISSRILKGEDGAIEGYFKFLSAGASVYPLEALGFAGVDMTNSATFYASFDVFESLLDEFEQLMDA